ncbi:unnamed protein product [Amoebophrya sp. A25]|nr:unnamed protein product [Amoebophrya sp. A25]|eukprot:GSA25T00014902001.1
MNQQEKRMSIMAQNVPSKDNGFFPSILKSHQEKLSSSRRSSTSLLSAFICRRIIAKSGLLRKTLLLRCYLYHQFFFLFSFFLTLLSFSALVPLPVGASTSPESSYSATSCSASPDEEPTCHWFQTRPSHVSGLSVNLCLRHPDSNECVSKGTRELGVWEDAEDVERAWDHSFAFVQQHADYLQKKYKEDTKGMTEEDLRGFLPPSQIVFSDDMLIRDVDGRDVEFAVAVDKDIKKEDYKLHLALRSLTPLEIARNKTYVDIGANIGAIAMPMIVRPEVHKVIAFEPFEDNLFHLRNSIAGLPLAKRRKVTLHEVALTEPEDITGTEKDHRGRQQGICFYSWAFNRGDSGILPQEVCERHFKRYGADEKIDQEYFKASGKRRELHYVPTKTLDELLFPSTTGPSSGASKGAASGTSSPSIKNIRLLKMDAQGHEVEILRGASKLLYSRIVRVWFFEVDPAKLQETGHKRPGELLDIFLDNDYGLLYHPEQESRRYKNKGKNLTNDTSSSTRSDERTTSTTASGQEPENLPSSGALQSAVQHRQPPTAGRPAIGLSPQAVIALDEAWLKSARCMLDYGHHYITLFALRDRELAAKQRAWRAESPCDEDVGAISLQGTKRVVNMS